MHRLLFHIALIFILTSCKTTESFKKELNTSQKDSVSIERIQVIDTFKIEERRIVSEIKLDSLIKFGYVEKKEPGVRTIIRYQDNKIDYECYCDSIQHLVISEIQKHYKSQSYNKSDQTVKTKTITKKDWRAITILSLIIGILTLIIILIIKNNGFKKIF